MAGIASGLGGADYRRRDFPKRFAVLFMGNGINGNHWWAKGSGAEMKLEQDAWQPLEPLKKKINVINGLFNKPAVGMGIHPGQTGNLLSGVPIQQGRDHQGGHQHGPGAGQAASARIRRSPSIVLACEQPMTGYHETNFSMAYSSHISWQSAGFAGAERSLSRRWPSTACSRTAAACAT